MYISRSWNTETSQIEWWDMAEAAALAYDVHTEYGTEYSSVQYSVGLSLPELVRGDINMISLPNLSLCNQHVANNNQLSLHGKRQSLLREKYRHKNYAPPHPDFRCLTSMILLPHSSAWFQISEKHDFTSTALPHPYRHLIVNLAPV